VNAPPESRSANINLFDTSLVGKLPINRLRMPEAVDAVLRHVRQVRDERSTGRAMHLFGVNAQVAVLALEDERFAQAMLSGHLLYPDGISIVAASRILGRPLIERIPGSELMELLCHEAAKEGLSAYFLGGLPFAAEKTAFILKHRYPGLVISGHSCPPFGFESDEHETAKLLRSIQDAAPDMLFVGLGAPKQERWIFANSGVLPVGVAVPVGAALDTISGYRKRAPVWARRTGLEWFYRLVLEPKRLWRRYLIGNTKFLLMVVTQWMQERKKAIS
jgi:N-acetylglucosaminyldiphosphoundecaprenol N-acetyl-beta-D-mannosaminyltransferase